MRIFLIALAKTIAVVIVLALLLFAAWRWADYSLPQHWGLFLAPYVLALFVALYVPELRKKKAGRK